MHNLKKGTEHWKTLLKKIRMFCHNAIDLSWVQAPSDLPEKLQNSLLTLPVKLGSFLHLASLIEPSSIIIICNHYSLDLLLIFYLLSI